MNQSTNSLADIDELFTLLDFVRWGVSQFNEADLYYGHGTDNPWDEAVTLVFFALSLPHDLTEKTGDALFNARLTASEKIRVAELVYMRAESRLPLPYITQQAWFAGLPFYVDERVLVPRSPFAELIGNGFAPYLSQTPSTILDLCTGGGCIAIALAKYFDDATVDALDISEDALNVAETNVEMHGLIDRVFPIKSDVFESVAGQKYDLIVSNPPYVDAEDMDDLPEEFQHEPELALASGQDGLELVERILDNAHEHLTAQGWCFIEVGNSLVHMEQRFKQLNIEWVPLESGGHGIFAVSAEELRRYASRK